jgi:hypothetical protein
LNEQFGYLYDAANNLSARTNNALVQSFSVNSLNQLTSASRSGTLTVAGTTSTTATNVTVNGSSATLYGDNTFAKDGFSLSDGNNTFTAIAQSSSGQADTNAVTVNLPASPSYTYDANGNLTGDGKWYYGYDYENRLVVIGRPCGNPSPYDNFVLFAYDALGRLSSRKEGTYTGSVGGDQRSALRVCGQAGAARAALQPASFHDHSTTGDHLHARARLEREFGRRGRDRRTLGLDRRGEWRGGLLSRRWERECDDAH